MKQSDRTSQLRPSPIRAISEGAPPGAVPMGLGEPGWALPEPACLALAQQQGPCAYGPNTGLPELKEAVAAFHGAKASQVMLGCGSQGVLYALFQAWLDPGAAVLVPDPGFLAYPALAHMAGAEPVSYALAPDFTLDPVRFRAALDRTPSAKVAVVNHPGNPTGAGTSAQALSEVAQACAARGILLLSDEVYRELCLGERGPSLRDVSDTGLVLGSVSKAWGAPGLRVGWAIGDPAWLAPARLVHAYMVTAPARPARLAAMTLPEASPAVLAEARRLGSALFGEAFRTKSGLMLGLGETEPEVLELCRALVAAGVDILTLGQYLRPTRHQLPVRRYLPPDEFRELGRKAKALGFRTVYAGPLVRSSFNAHEVSELEGIAIA